MNTITMQELANRFQLDILVEGNAATRKVETEEIHRPSLELTGFFDHFPKKRIQVLGSQEIAYIYSLPEDTRIQRIKQFIQMNPYSIVLTAGLEARELAVFQSFCKKCQVMLCMTKERATEFASKANNYLRKQLAQSLGVHGVCVNVYGIGILIRGKSGVGKSEVALSLIERGHRLVSDDLVNLKKIGPTALIGTDNENNRGFLALRGVGLVDIPRLYGVGAIQEETKVELDILLSGWEDGRYYDSIGVDPATVTYLDIDVQHMEIPIRPGRDVASLIEVAAKTFRLKLQGYDPLKEFQSRIQHTVKKNEG